MTLFSPGGNSRDESFLRATFLSPIHLFLAPPSRRPSLPRHVLSLLGVFHVRTYVRLSPWRACAARRCVADLTYCGACTRPGCKYVPTYAQTDWITTASPYVATLLLNLPSGTVSTHFSYTGCPASGPSLASYDRWILTISRPLTRPFLSIRLASLWERR